MSTSCDVISSLDVLHWTPIVAIWTCLSFPAAVWAQAHEHSAPGGTGWSISFSGQAFLTANLQVRKFTDFHQVESQNWFMTALERPGPRRFSVHAMFSLEPWTLRRLGSAQAFQTGETLDGAPLIDYQHPHDLLMGLEASVEWSKGDATKFRLSGGPVGSAALGPMSFMHRASAVANPTVPLSHHLLDSTHIARSVVTFGVTHRTLTFEASAFKGREPDEDRLDLDGGIPDSGSARVTWTTPRWQAQISAGRLRQPEPTERFDVTRVTASVSHSGTFRNAPLAVTVAAGRNHEFQANLDGFLVEAAWTPARRTLYARAEVVEKEILTLGGLDPPEFQHAQVLSRLGALTIGYAHALAEAISVGGDLTVHAVPDNLRDSYGRPVSVHIYLRWHSR